MEADTPTVYVTGATAADAEALCALLEADLAELRIAHDPERLGAAVAQLVAADPDRVWLLVARVGAVDAPPVGVLIAHRWVSAKFAGDALWIETLHVSSTARRLGIGRRLTSSAIDRAREQGLRGVDLEAYRMNAPASYLYRALGFRRLSRERYSLPLRAD